MGEHPYLLILIGAAGGGVGAIAWVLIRLFIDYMIDLFCDSTTQPAPDPEPRAANPPRGWKPGGENPKPIGLRPEPPPAPPAPGSFKPIITPAPPPLNDDVTTERVSWAVAVEREACARAAEECTNFTGGTYCDLIKNPETPASQVHDYGRGGCDARRAIAQAIRARRSTDGR